MTTPVMPASSTPPTPLTALATATASLPDGPLESSDLVGVYEVAVILGTTRSNVNNLRIRGTLPEPVARLRSGTIWRRADIDAYVAARCKRKILEGQ